MLLLARMLDLQLLEDMELLKILVLGQTLLDQNLKQQNLGLSLDLHHLVLLAKQMEQQLALLNYLWLLLLMGINHCFSYIPSRKE